MVGRKSTYIFHQHRALIATPVAISQSRYQSSRVHLKQGLRFLIRIDLDILIRDARQLQRDPYSLHKRTAIVLSVSRKFWRQWTGERLYVYCFIKTYQKQLPNSFKSESSLWLTAVNAAAPVALVWYVFWPVWCWTGMVLIFRTG